MTQMKIMAKSIAMFIFAAAITFWPKGANGVEQSMAAAALEWELTNLEFAPESRMGTAMAFFDSTSELILFGGNFNSKSFDDTWGWDGTKWTEKKTAHRPPKSNSHAMAYDPIRKEIVLIGGFQNGKMGNGTWLYNGKDWREAKPATKPQYSVNSAMAFNHASGRVMLFGGTFDDANKFWEWDGQNWVKITFDAGPAPRAYAGLAFDQARNEMIMFGGITNPYEAKPKIYNDTWAWNGKSWHAIPTPVSPSSRYYHKMEYHPELKAIILVGGRKGKRDNGPGPEGLFSDTWSWNGNAWTQHPSKNSIQPAYSYGMGYNKLTKVFFAYLGDSLMCATRGPKIFTLRKGKSGNE